MLSVAGEVFILIDALDEYQNRSTQRYELLTWIESFHDEPVNTHLLVTSRPEHDIKTSLEAWGNSDSIISLRTDNVGRDISDYVHDVVTKSTSFRRWHGQTSIRNDIVKTLTAKADGVFRWVALQLERLKDCINKEEVKITLDSLPETLQETYYRVLSELTSTRRKHVIRILQFLAYSNLQMDLEAAVDALAIDLTAPPGSRFIMKERMPLPSEISSLCSTLFVAVSKTKWRKIHGRWFHDKRPWSIHRLRKYDQLFYASWSGDQNCVKKLLDARATSDTIEWRLDFALHVASEFGHLETVALLIREGAHVNAEGEINNLCTAVEAGHTDVVALLIKEGADVNAQQGPYGNALEVASASGRMDIIEILIKQGANINAQSFFSNALYSASLCGHLNIVIFLLENGADVNAQGGYFGSALCAASRSGHLNIVTYLVGKGADVNAQGQWFGNALHVAMTFQEDAIVKFLRNHQVDLRLEVIFHVWLCLNSLSTARKAPLHAIAP
ncbi:putative ankyrin repeat protein L25 [Fusarium oxysporum f. sp. rapae]|uniref:Putative ankyrin repeat protein L25 n=1 Tax=Fusarium oxysporum f. sp. rapae TaxID=485398 RepID=A0A8J5NTQ8_FUSOX|nr:putative ankyrin repeat protein L25 [Fusarium oxysporum f. sp. rapae]